MPSLLHPSTLTLAKLKADIGWPADGLAGLLDMRVFLCVSAYYGFLLATQVLLPGIEMEGQTLVCGGRHRYKFNTLRTTLLLLAGCAVGTIVYGPDFALWTFIWDHYLQIITVNMVFSFALSIYVYGRSFSVPLPGAPNAHYRELAAGGHTGNVVYDFWIGRELNPRVRLPVPFVSEVSRTLDIKTWCELRPGLIGWVILNLAHAAHQWKFTGGMTLSMAIVVFAQVLYVIDSFVMEPALLTTMDVIMDGFGFMLAFGDLVWVPFSYTLQSRYLAVFPHHMGPMGLAVTIAVQAIGYYIFRASNSQKNRFRINPADPRVAHLSFISTRTGSRLLTSGWWGMARHVNYLGDWLMSWAYCLPTGIAGYVMVSDASGRHAEQTPEVRGWGMLVTYFFMLYFAILLVHRETRDDEKCRRKYGEDWERYTQAVPSRIVPGIY